MFEESSFPVALMDIPHPIDHSDGAHIVGRKAIMRLDNNEVLNIVSSKYPLVKHADVFNTVEDALGVMGLPIKYRKESVGNGGGFARVEWGLDTTFTMPGTQVEDLLNPTIVARNSYNYTSELHVEIGTRRLICTNGMTVGHMLKGASRRHTKGLNMQAVINEITSEMSKIPQVQAHFKKWAETPYTKVRFSEWLEQSSTLSKDQQQRTAEYFTIQPDRLKVGGMPQENGWEAFNSLTWLGSHGMETRRADTLVLAQERVNAIALTFARQELGLVGSN